MKHTVHAKNELVMMDGTGGFQSIFPLCLSDKMFLEHNKHKGKCHKISQKSGLPLSL